MHAFADRRRVLMQAVREMYERPIGAGEILIQEGDTGGCMQGVVVGAGVVGWNTLLVPGSAAASAAVRVAAYAFVTAAFPATAATAATAPSPTPLPTHSQP